jgi:hypothetical protein
LLGVSQPSIFLLCSHICPCRAIWRLMARVLGLPPPAVLTLQRDRKCYGYFSGSRFVRRSGELADEIAMNPAHFAAHPIENTLSTLAHEMVHQWQHHHGKPGRRGYHNAEWASRMETIGLMPSNTGAPDGKRTGEKMDHYIIDGGPFAVACASLLVEPFTINWLDRMAIMPKAPPEADIPPDLAALGIEPAKPGKRVGNRVKYRCVTCKMQAWGKPGLPLLCGTCQARPLEAVEEDSDAL